MKQKYKILLAIFTVCLIASGLLAFTPIEKICGEETSSCAIVQNSEYKDILGASNSLLGIFAFTVLIFITASHSKNPKRHKKLFLVFGTTISAIAALYFIYLQAFVIKAFCPYCMTIDIGSILAFVIIITTNNKNK
jgi:uncharacterized membrane protein